MTRRIFLPLLSLLVFLTPVRAETDTRVYELRTYWAAPGKLENLHARFRDHAVSLLAKHGAASAGYWTPAENQDRRLIFLLTFPNREARDAIFKAFSEDPEWKAVMKESEANGKLVEKVESRILTPTDFSPPVKPETAAAPARVFELRTYTAATGKLENLLARFRDHTVELFAKHGMKNFGYWIPASGEAGAADMLIYLLIHESAAAKDASFKAFGADPVWVAAKNASEKAGGGSLTAKDGVKSELLIPTDYSPAK